METAQETQPIRRRGRPAKIRESQPNEFTPEEAEMDSDSIESAADGEVLNLSPSTVAAVDQLRAFYRNNRGIEITRDQAILFASGIALTYGRSITKTMDGRLTRVHA